LIEEIDDLKNTWEVIKERGYNHYSNNIRIQEDTSAVDSSSDKNETQTGLKSVNSNNVSYEPGLYRTSTLPTPKNTSSKELNTDSRSKILLNNLSQADLDDASVPLNFDDLPEMDINKFLSQQEDDSRRNVQSFENLSSTGQVSNSIGRMSFGRSKKQSNKKSQGTLNVSAVGNLPATAKKDYAAGLMAIEERLKP
jgi:hypothetical protein